MNIVGSLFRSNSDDTRRDPGTVPTLQRTTNPVTWCNCLTYHSPTLFPLSPGNPYQVITPLRDRDGRAIGPWFTLGCGIKREE